MYDDGNDDWLTHNGNKNECPIAYYGIGKKLDNIFIVEKAMECILIWGFKPGKIKAYEKYTNDNSNDQIKLLEDVFIVV